MYARKFGWILALYSVVLFTGLFDRALPAILISIGAIVWVLYTIFKKAHKEFKEKYGEKSK